MILSLDATTFGNILNIKNNILIQSTSKVIFKSIIFIKSISNYHRCYGNFPLTFCLLIITLFNSKNQNSYF